ncbi:MAG: succinyl-diaminopimelate desuccinylase [Polyangiaceae bacterium]|jgi:succinyl-diaminopimelate desuccinylase
MSEVDQLLDRTLFDLCAVPSPIGEEKTLCDAVHDRVARLPLPSPARRYKDSLVVPILRRRGRHVALVGHLDTVRTENGPPRVEDGRCFGAGASDMKSGLAVMLAIAEALPLDRLACDLTLVFYAREEGPYAENELGYVLDHDPELAAVDLAVCMEPSDNRLHLGCVGSIHAKVTFEGQTAHSARPWEGRNAITRAAGLLAELDSLIPRESTIDGLTFRGVTTVTQAHDGGRGRNVVPDRFVLNLNHRFPPDRTIEQAQREVLALVANRGHVEFIDLSPAALPNATHPLVRSLIACGVRGVEPKQAWTDVARFAQLGVAAVNFGPGENAQAHRKNESTSLALLHEGYAIVSRWLQSIAP